MDNPEQENEVLSDPEIFEDIPESENKKKEFNPKLVLFFIVVISALGLVFAYSGILTSLKVPFAKIGDVSELNANFSLADSDAANLLDLQQKDTDLDGLSDYDELYLYKTSPYLPDSDSDGYSDFEEIQNEYDPNCPSGQDCLSLETDQEVAPVLPGLEQELSVEEIRQLLIDGGMPEEEAKAIDDQTLIQLYQESLQDFENSQTAADSLPAGYDSLSPTQLREILIAEGFPKEDLDNLTDEELLEVWNEIVKEEFNQNSN